MSTPPPASPSLPTPAAAAPPTSAQEIRIISHSTLFYWWPVWTVGLLLGMLSFFGHKQIASPRMALLPKDTEGYVDVTVERKSGEPLKNRDVLVLPEKAQLLRVDPDKPDSAPVKPYLHMAANRAYGVVFAFVLLLVIVITNVPLRGLWSVIVIIVAILMTIIFWLADWWESIFGALGQLSIYINAGGYLFISLVLLGVWLVTFLLFDQQIYMIFTSGQLRVRTEIGGGETAYDTQGMTVQKQRSDLFRHWVLGLGSGDLIVKTSGAQAHHFDLPNVLFIGKKVKQIEDMLREKPVVRGN